MSRFNELSVSTDEVITELPVYQIDPGGLYWVSMPEEWSEAEVAEYLASFKAGDRVLDPPAHFIFTQGAAKIESATREDLVSCRDRYQELLDDHDSEFKATP